jgi:hypothetical protein
MYNAKYSQVEALSQPGVCLLHCEPVVARARASRPRKEGLVDNP